MDTVTVKNATFYTKSRKTDEKPFEKFLLNGTYAIKEYNNTAYTFQDLVEIYGINIFHCKNPFYEGNVLLKTDEPDVEDKIELIIKSSCETKKLPDHLDTSNVKKVQMVGEGGTICPTKEEIFRYNGYVYYLYGRYIYGFNYPYVLFTNENVDKDKYNSNDGEEEVNKDEEYEEYEESVPNKLLSVEKIILPEKKCDIRGLEYNYAFLIEKENNNELVAFGIYK